MDTNMTVHAKERAKERGIQTRLVDLVLEWGETLPRNPDRLLLTRRHLHRIWEAGCLERAVFLRAEQAVPLVCVVREGRLVTVFRPRRAINRAFDQRSRRRRGRRFARTRPVGVAA
jgi:hypothetical protein